MTGANHSTETLYFNGVNGATGGYLFEPQTVEQISELAQNSIIADRVDGYAPNAPTSDTHLSALSDRDRHKEESDFALIEGIDPKQISETGWGIIFPAQIDPEIKDALKELMEHRRAEAGEYFHEYEIYPGESANDFLGRFDANVFDPVDPRKVPYYLLIVGDFQQISFEVQYQLDVQYAVGRIYFPKAADYAQYAHSVVTAETTQLALPCRADLFGVSNPGDRSTQLSSKNPIQPLSEFLTTDSIFQKNNSHWQIETHLEEQATKSQLSQLLGGENTPAFLFTASHGMGFPNDDSRQLPHQGALLCQDWPGPQFQEPIPEDFYWSADDISDRDRLFGLISFHFACYGAGTPQMDQFGHRRNDWKAIAPHDFMARLPQRLLSHPKGGALAAIGHVDRAWGYSFGSSKQQINTFQSTIQRLTEGHPVGSALEFFNERYAAISSELTKELWYIKANRKPNDAQLSYLWTANNDARGYAIIGDPAVRLMVGTQASAEAKRPEIEAVEFAVSASDRPEQPELPVSSPPSSTPTTTDALSGLVGLLDNLVARVEQLEQQMQDLKDRENS
ncbi:hypothetical protein [Roseofilum casamattae]|uniref:Gingipain domain-containing protein n=1 Tax=Roseofilum casamattae BLCC-M143 TaxID=3022442 RepID=A0ABT7C059_9CYAN|nr:hypothetical protein [Roseofilum casamattae]MDJ1184700.1 hypothetical protein [Roseofilum casamattae BLCC-M143]